VRILVAGALGEVGRTLTRTLALRGHEVIQASGRAPVDGTTAIGYLESASLIEAGSIDLVVNAAGRGDRRSSPRSGQDATNALAPAVRESGVPAVLMSTTRVLEGYGLTATESDPARPLTAYGEANAEHEVTWLATIGDSGRVLRIANYFCSPSSREAPQAQLLPWSLVTEALDSGRIAVRSSPETTREFVDAADVATAIEILGVDRPPSGFAATTPGIVLRLEDLVRATVEAFEQTGRPVPTVTFGSETPIQPTWHGTWLTECGWRARFDITTLRASISAWLTRGCLD